MPLESEERCSCYCDQTAGEVVRDVVGRWSEHGIFSRPEGIHQDYGDLGESANPMGKGSANAS